MNSTINLLDDAALKFGNNIGYQDEEEKISFLDLQKKGIIIGTRLIKDMGSPGTISPVLIFIPKSVKSIVSFMGTLYSGNPYVPIDTNMPMTRVQRIINNLKPGAIISSSEDYEKFGDMDLGPAILYDYEDIVKGQGDRDLIDARIEGVVDRDPVYIMYTSGSTGEPKGVTIPHCGVIDYAKWVVEVFNFDQDTIMANQAPFYFDNSVFEIYGCMVSGGKMILIPEVLMMFPLKLPEFLEDHKINTIFWVPTVMINVANSGALSKYKLPHLKTVAFCGEIMPNKQLNIWRRHHPDCLYANLYGPTEITDVSTYYIVDREFSDSDPLPIGRACKNTRNIILNEKDEIAKIGQEGELCIIGTGLALGYWGNKDLTDEVFTQNPTNPYYNEMIYRTGDLAYLNEENLIMIIGRMDSQIKLRGNRVELGEVENAAMCIEGVKRACAIFNEVDQEIVLFLESPGDFTIRKVNRELSKYIPRYMHPHKLFTLESLPHTSNDKIDRVKLKEEYFKDI